MSPVGALLRSTQQTVRLVVGRPSRSVACGSAGRSREWEGVRVPDQHITTHCYPPNLVSQYHQLPLASICLGLPHCCMPAQHQAFLPAALIDSACHAPAKFETEQRQCSLLPADNLMCTLLFSVGPFITPLFHLTPQSVLWRILVAKLP